MKKITLLMTVLFAVAGIYGASAQEVTGQNIYTAPESKRAQNVFIEVLGQGLALTANYDTRFTNKRDGIGGRIGIGHISTDGSSFTSIPVSLNYLLGKDRQFFEVGLGATFATATLDGDFLDFDDSDEDESGNGVIGTMSFSYRLQPVDSGFAFRAGVTPVFGRNFFIPYYFGLSLGYTF